MILTSDYTSINSDPIMIESPVRAKKKTLTNLIGSPVLNYMCMYSCAQVSNGKGKFLTP